MTAKVAPEDPVEEGEHTAPKRPTGRRLAVSSTLVVLYVVLVQVRIRTTGASVTVDGRKYLARADALRHGDLAFSSISSRPLHFPPLYPALLALLDGLSPLDAAQAGLAINLVSVVALLWGIDRLLTAVHGHGGGPWGWRLLLPWSVLVTGLMVIAGGSVLSDLAFYAVWAWLLVALLEVVHGGGRRWLVALGVLGAAAIALRYAAGFLVAGAVVVLALEAWRSRRPALARAAAAVAAASAGPIVAWYAWAGRYGGGATQGHGQLGVLGVRATATDSLVALGSDVLGLRQLRPGGFKRRSGFKLPHLNDQVPTISVLLALALLGAAVWLLWRSRHALRLGPSIAATDADAPSIQRRQATDLWVLLVPTLTYVGLMFTYRAYSGFFVIQRYWGLAPATILLALSTVAARDARRPPLLTVALALLCLACTWGTYLSLRL